MEKIEKIVVGNMKMNITNSLEREQYFSALKKELSGKKLGRTEIVICPPVIYLESFVKSFGNRLKIGVQNIFWEDKGSYTGEISPRMARNFGASYVIVGHSERRKYFNETNQVVNMKIIAALKNSLIPIVCLGETKAEKQRNQTMQVVSSQLKSALLNISRAKMEKIILVYEPIWSVGTDEIPSSHEIMEARVLIKKIIVQLYDKKTAENAKILYGGSVSSASVKQTCVESAMDGALIGRESLSPFEFLKIAEIINQ